MSKLKKTGIGTIPMPEQPLHICDATGNGEVRLNPSSSGLQSNRLPWSPLFP